MLQFIIGRASSGKSYEICTRIAECVKCGGSPILIIPEQFSFESEKRILSLLGDMDAQKVKVLSFSRLCDEVENVVGGSVADIGDSDKIILMSIAIRHVKDKLKCFGKYGASSGFCKMMLSTVDTFCLNAVTCADIFEAAEQMKESLLGRKLYDTAYIFSEYEELIAEKFSAVSDRLTWLFNTLEKFEFFRGKEVYIDSFNGFTGQQYKVIDRIISTADNTTVSLCCDADDSSFSGIFANVHRTKERIKKIASSHGVKIIEDFALKSGKYVSEGLSAIEEYLCHGRTEYEINNGELTVCRAQTALDEASFAARNIRRIIREEGARLSDFVVISRDVSEYEQSLLSFCNKNGIRCFCDRRLPLNSLPPAVAAITAMELAGGISTEKILRFHKCGVGFLTRDEISELENYVYIWNIDGGTWLQNWNMDPRGLVNSETDEVELVADLEHINALRKKAVEPINGFIDVFGKSTKNMARAVVSLLENSASKGAFLTFADSLKDGGDLFTFESIATAYSKVMSIMDSLVNCLPDDAGKREFINAFKTCAENVTIGVIPQMIDEVTFGSAERIQPSRPSYVFVLGANSGVFPRAPQTNGVFAISEIGKIRELGIDIPDCLVDSLVDEDLLVYNCVCCADKRAFISYNTRAGEPSYFLKKLIERFSITEQIEPNILSIENLPETAEDTFSRFCRSEHGSADYETIKLVLAGKEEYESRVSLIDGNEKRPDFKISPELSRELTGNRIHLSPSKFDTYSKCAFMYFCKYLLSVKPLEPVRLSPLQSGTFIHYVLQRFIEDNTDRVATLGDEEISDLTKAYVKDYLDSFKGYRDVETPHLRLMVQNITETLIYLCKRLRDEFSQSDFKPERCELVIGNGGNIPPLNIDVDGDIKVIINGIVDRLDRYGAYIRIIDYKSGKKDFKLPDILVGQNMQMLIYLYAVCRDENMGGQPAGIFYMRAALPDGTSPASRRMSGFMPDDGELVTAMDKSGKGEYIPQSNPRTSAPTVSKDEMYEIFDFLERKIKSAGRNIADGIFSALPIDGLEKKACEYCNFASICRLEKEKPQQVLKLNANEVMEEIRKQVSGNEI